MIHKRNSRPRSLCILYRPEKYPQKQTSTPPPPPQDHPPPHKNRPHPPPPPPPPPPTVFRLLFLFYFVLFFGVGVGGRLFGGYLKGTVLFLFFFFFFFCKFRFVLEPSRSSAAMWDPKTSLLAPRSMSYQITVHQRLHYRLKPLDQSHSL